MSDRPSFQACPRGLPFAAAAALGLLLTVPPLQGAAAGAGIPTQSPDTIPALPLPPDTLPIPGDTTTVVEVEGVVVDILRSPMQLTEIPFAVSVLGRELQTRGRSNASIEEALHGLPGVQVQNRFNDAVGERITIRGFGSRSPFGVRGVHILVDGIPATLPDGQSTLDHLDLGSLGRVEALRGPGSALYGNAAGGVLNFQSEPPPASPFRQEVSWIQGDHGLERVQTTTSGRVGQGGYRVSFGRHDFGGYRSLPGGEPHQRYGTTAREQANVQGFFPLAGGHFRVTGHAVEMDAENAGSIDLATLALGDRRAFSGNVTQGARKWLRHGQLGLGWEGQAGDRELELMLYGVHRDVDNPLPTEVLDLVRRAGGFRAMIRSEDVGEVGRLWWAMGVEGNLQLDRRLAFRNNAGKRGFATQYQSERVLGMAAFVQAMLPISPVLDVLTGVRYDRMHFRATDRMPFVGSDSDASGSRALDSASPSFGFHLGLHRAFQAYANLSTAFETPTTSELANRPSGERGFNPDLEPQVGITTEVGARGLLGLAFAYEVTYFHTTLHGELLPFELDDYPGRRYFRNAGRSVRSGVEVALQVAPSQYLSVRGTYATNDARFRSFEVDGMNHAGRRVPGLAPQRVEGIVRVGPGSWFVEARGEHTAAIPGNDANDPEARSPAYRLADLRAGLNDVGVGRVRMSPFLGITNLFDEVYNTSVVVNAQGGRYFEPGPGRSLYLGGRLAVEW